MISRQIIYLKQPEKWIDHLKRKEKSQNKKRSISPKIIALISKLAMRGASIMDINKGNFKKMGMSNSPNAHPIIQIISIS